MFKYIVLIFFILGYSQQEEKIKEIQENQQEQEESEIIKDPFEQKKYKKLLKQRWQQISERELEEYLWDLPKNIVLFCEEQEVKELKVFEEVAKQVKEELEDKEMIFSQVIINDKSVSYRKYNINTSTMVILFIKHQFYPFTGHFTSENLLHFILQHCKQQQLIQLNTTQQFHQFQQQYQSYSKVICIYSNETHTKELELMKQMVENDVLHDSGNYIVGFTYDQSIIPYPHETYLSCLILYTDHPPNTSFDHPPNTSFDHPPYTSFIYKGPLNHPSSILHFLNTHSLPFITFYSTLYSYRILTAPSQIYLILNSTDTHLQQQFTLAAQHNYNNYYNNYYNNNNNNNNNDNNNNNNNNKCVFVVLYFQAEHQELLGSLGVFGSEQLP